jgi:plasmid stabilization system protein ParE
MPEGLKNMIAVRWSPEARDDFDEIYLYLARESHIYTENLFDKIEEIIEKLRKFPKMGG